VRFRKSIKHAPGVRWNLSGSGRWTIDPWGASVGIDHPTRLVGEVFAALRRSRWWAPPAARSSPTGDPAMRDDYLPSFRVPRDAWERLAFAHLRALDATRALAAYELPAT
jgi:hypothetical protein